MKLNPVLTIVSAALFCGFVSYSVTALAETQGKGPAPISAEKMEAIKACAAAKGVTMPEPPKGPPPQKGEKPSGERPKISDADRAVLDACFKENGVEPPKGPPHGKKGPQNEKPSENNEE